MITNVRACSYYAGFVMKISSIIHVPLRCGIDWDMDLDVTDQTFNDIGHFELVGDY